MIINIVTWYLALNLGDEMLPVELDRALHALHVASLIGLLNCWGNHAPLTMNYCEGPS